MSRRLSSVSLFAAAPAFAAFLAISGLAISGASLAACGGSDPVTSTEASPSATSPNKPAPTTPTPSSTSTSTPEKDGGGPTTPSKPVKFIAMGDTGTNDTGQFKIANTISALCKARGCDFVQLLGDNIYPSGASSVDDQVWADYFETPYAVIDLPFFAVLGNHDYGADGAGTDFGRGQIAVDYSKTKSQKFKLPGKYYHHTKENVEFFGLDTNMQMFGQDEDQRKDFKDWIAASKTTWKIAFGHHPIKSNGDHGNAGNYDPIGGVIPLPSPFNGANVKSFMDDVICGKVDLYFCGHDHSRQWLNVSCGGTELAVSGAGAKATELKGDNPALFQSIELGFLYVVIDGKKLTAEFIDEEGQVEFTHVVNKP